MDVSNPVCLNLLKNFLLDEAEHSEKKVNELKGYIKNKAQNMRSEIARRKLLKAEIEKGENQLRSINFANDKLMQTSSQLKDELEIAEAGQDFITRTSTMYIQEYKNVLKKFEETWAEYEAKYEQLPLAQVRKQTRIDLENARQEKERLEKRISENIKQRLEMSRQNWEKARKMIVEFAKLWVDHQKDCKTVEERETQCEKQRNEIESCELELKALQERETELNAKKTDKIDLDSLFVKPTEPVRTYGKKMQKPQKLPRTISDDSLTSLDSCILESMCKNAENILKNADNVACGDTETAKTRKHNEQEGTAQLVQLQQENSVPSAEKQAESQINTMRTKQEISQPNRKQLNESQAPKVNTTEPENIQTKSKAEKKQQPKVICVEKQTIKMKLVNSGHVDGNRINITKSGRMNEKEMMDLDNNTATTNNINILSGEGDKEQVTPMEAETVSALPELPPDKSKTNPKNEKSSVVCDQAMIDDTMDIAVESKSITSSQIERMEQAGKSNEMETDPISADSSYFQNSNNMITDCEFGAKSVSADDSIMKLKMSDCSFISRTGDDNAVDNSSLCNDCVAKENEGDTDDDKDADNKDGRPEGRDIPFLASPENVKEISGGLCKLTGQTSRLNLLTIFHDNHLQNPVDRCT